MLILKIAVAIIVGLIIGFFVKYYALAVSLSDARLCSILSCCMNCKRKITISACLNQLIKHKSCKWCKNKLSNKYHLIEISVSLIFTAGAVSIADTVELIEFCVLALFLAVASVVDIKIMKIPYFTGFGILLVGLAVFAVSLFSQNSYWKSQLLGVALIAVLFAVPALSGKTGGGDFQLMVAGCFVLGLSGAVVAILITILAGFFRSVIAVVCTPRSVIEKHKSVIHTVIGEWYDRQKELGIVLEDNGSDTFCFNINNKIISTDESCYNAAKWSSEPDIALLKEMIESRITDCSYRLSVVIRLEQTEDSTFNMQVNCKRIIALAPYISVGILVSYLLCV